MKQQQPISFYLDPVIWGDFQQPEPLTVLRALTSMQLPPRTVSFIMKGVKQSPHAAQHSTHTQVVRSDALRVTNDKHQSGRRRALAHSFSLSHLVTSTPPPPSFCHHSAMQHGVYRLYKLSPLDHITANMIAPAQFVTLGLAGTSSPRACRSLIFSRHYWVICTGISDSVHLVASVRSAWTRRQGTEGE